MVPLNLVQCIMAALASVVAQTSPGADWVTTTERASGKPWQLPHGAKYAVTQNTKIVEAQWLSPRFQWMYLKASVPWQKPAAVKEPRETSSTRAVSSRAMRVGLL